MPVSARGVAVVALLFAARGGEAAERLRVTVARAGLYSRASADSFHLLSLEKGAEVEVVQRAGDWFSVKVLTSAVKGAVGVKGFVSRADVEAVAVAEPASPPLVPRPSPRAAPTPPPSVEPARPAPPRPAPAVPAVGFDDVSSVKRDAGGPLVGLGLRVRV